MHEIVFMLECTGLIKIYGRVFVVSGKTMEVHEICVVLFNILAISLCQHVSVFCLRFKPRNHWKIPSEQSCLACRFSHWKSLYNLPMKISRNSHWNLYLIEWKAPLKFVEFRKCSSILQFVEIQTRIFHRMESAIDFSLHGACFLNVFFITI